MQHLIDQAAQHIDTLLSAAFLHSPNHGTVIIYDEQAPLTRLLTEAYRQVLPDARCVNFDDSSPAQILDLFDELLPHDLVILIQSANFRLNDFRIRLELFKRQLKTIEYIHLARMSEEQFPIYIDALAYDRDYYQHYGLALKQHIDHAKKIVVTCPGTTLVYDSPMEEAKLNIGDYSNMENVGGTFPIGEVFSEPKDLTRVNGQAVIFAYAGTDHVVRTPTPFKVDITQGILTAPNAPQEFQDILDLIRSQEEVWVREFGLGLNRAMYKGRIVNDITAFERMKGLHFSLGGKHGVYQKPGLEHKKVRYHVDVFIDVETITIDNQVIFKNGEYKMKTASVRTEAVT